MKKFSAIMMAAMCGAVVSYVVIHLSPLTGLSSAASAQVATNATITVVSEAQDIVTPNMAVIAADVSTKASTAEVAQKDNDTAMNKVLKALNQAGVAANAVQTQNYRVTPNYGSSQSGQSSTVVGFDVNTHIEVTVSNIIKAGRIVDMLVQAGANQIDNVSFQISNPVAENLKLADAAIAKAQAEATHIAQTLGDNITGVQSVDMITVPNIQTTPQLPGSNVNNSSSLSPVSQRVSAQVKVVFTIGSGSTGSTTTFAGPNDTTGNLTANGNIISNTTN